MRLNALADNVGATKKSKRVGRGRGGRTHLVSPGMAIAAAIKGHLSDVREI